MTLCSSPCTAHAIKFSNILFLVFAESDSISSKYSVNVD